MSTALPQPPEGDAPMHTVAPADGTVDLAPGTASAVSWPWRWLVFWCCLLYTSPSPRDS